MIGCAACDHLKRGHISSWNLGVQSRLPITDVMTLYLG
ncbi:YgjD/Kae1/Qri7 family, required for threonylcarbamoyladenosine (t(6)A) formation in tRNA [Crocosphaera watsonii WH 0005]|nr:YgjD/Kae1/Qri7 family, required for threonylcarbamoyladenosine (t(6)A) formation in tRNA [Crocosphaera watsonii WH 0005]